MCDLYESSLGSICYLYMEYCIVKILYSVVKLDLHFKMSAPCFMQSHKYTRRKVRFMKGLEEKI